jgi:adenylylsulfate kinase-like enzyme
MVNIQKLQIENFRSIGSVCLEIDGGVFMTGMNGAGKSSVLEAIRFALLGYCTHTDKRGAGAKALIAHGADEASIAIRLMGGRDMAAALVQVAIPQSGSVRWSAQDAETGKPIATKPEQLWAWLNVSEATLAAALLPAEHITTQGFEGVLGELQAGTVEPPVLYDLCGKEHIEALLEDYPPNLKDGSLPTQLKTLNGLRTVGDDAYEWRRAAGRKVKELEAQIPAAPPQPPTDRNGAPLGTDAAAALKKNIGKLSEARDALMRELGEARQMAKVTPAGSVEELEAAIAAAQEASDKAAKAAEAAQAEHVRVVDALEAAKRNRDGARFQAEKLEGHIEELTGKIESYAAGRACETCGVKWTEARVRTATSKLRQERMQLVEQFNDAERLDAKFLADLEKARGLAAQAGEPAREATKAAIAASADLANLRRELELAKRVSGVRSPEAVEADLLEIDERLDRAKAAMGQLAIVAEYEAKKADLEAARARYAHMDWRVKAFRDGEILNELGADGLKTFEQAVDHALMPFGYGFAFEVDGRTVKVLFGRRGEALRPIERASSGERKLAEVAVAMTFAQTAGIALVDDLDHLDGKNRNQALSGIAHDVREGHPTGHSIQVIAAGAWGKAYEPDPDTLAAIGKALDPLKVIWVCVEGVPYERMFESCRETTDATLPSIHCATATIWRRWLTEAKAE